MSLLDLSAKQDTYKDWRQHLHAHPELGFEEFKTSDFVAKRLEDFGLDIIHRGIAETGIVGVLHSSHGKDDTETGSHSIALRADMDALPMDEHNDFDHASTHDGCMHACGHDGHTTMLLAAAEYLSENRDCFKGTVYFFFQPAEEGKGGARVMVQEGVFDRFPCKAIYGMHTWPALPVGTMAVRPGPMTANSDRFHLTLNGKGGHAAWPHFNADIVTAGAEIVTALNHIVSRKIDPLESAVISTSMFQAGSSPNVMPETATIAASVRSYGEATRQKLHDEITNVITHISNMHGITADIDYHFGYPSVINSEEETDLAITAMQSVVGVDHVDTNVTSVMGAEDFAFFLQRKKGCYVVIGQGKTDNDPGLHNSKFDFNDDVIPIGASYWTSLAKTCLPTS